MEYVCRGGLGCRCVSDEPWVTIAESCELTIALIAAGDFSKASELFSWLHRWRLKDGSYWTGINFLKIKYGQMKSQHGQQELYF